MGSLGRRLDALEGGEPKKACPECGRTPGVKPGVRLVTKEDPEWNPTNESCPRCGELLRFTLNLGAKAYPWPYEEDV